METSELLFKSMVGVMVATGKQAVIIKYVEVLTIFYFFALQPWPAVQVTSVIQMMSNRFHREIFSFHLHMDQTGPPQLKIQSQF